MKDPVAGDRADKPYVSQPPWQLALVDRVASGAAFKKSPRLKDLLLFLCERAVSDPSASVHEQEIGNKVFGRSPDYDTTEDPLVRVQVSQLRRKLQQHFESEGKNEPVVIEIPKGCYTPVFRERQGTPLLAVLPWTERVRARVTPIALLLAVLAVAISLTVWFAFLPHNLSEAIRAATEPRSALDLFWSQLSVGGRQVCMVPSDSNFLLFEKLLDRRLPLSAYRRGIAVLNSLADEHIADLELRAAAKLVLGKSCSPFADLQLVRTIESRLTPHRIHVDVIHARNFTPAYFVSHDVILLGNARANRWLEMFEHYLNFRTRVDRTTRESYFENRSPLAGEEAAYRLDPGRHLEYCSVAFLPNPPRTGTVLLISGTSVRSTEAGGQFVLSERWMQALHSRLGLDGTERFPFFEVLLELEILAADSFRFKMVAHRVPKTEDMTDPLGTAPE
jgi:hypothetical protein